MYNFLVKNGQAVSFGLGLLITIIFLFGAVGGDDPDRFNFGLGIAILLAIACAIAMVAFGVWQVVSNPKGSLKGIATIVGLVIVFGILYSTSGSDVGSVMKEFNVDGGTGQVIAGAIKTTVLLLAATAAALAFSLVRDFFK